MAVGLILKPRSKIMTLFSTDAGKLLAGKNILIVASLTHFRILCQTDDRQDEVDDTRKTLQYAIYRP